MYPAIVAWLASGPLPWLAMLVPKPGLLYAVVLLACGAVFARRVTRVGIDSDRALEALLAAAVGALIGTRAFYLVTRTRFWEMSLAQLIDGRQGTASWGAYLGGFIGLILYSRWRGYQALQLTDAATSAAPTWVRHRSLELPHCRRRLRPGDQLGRGASGILPTRCPGTRIAAPD